MTKRTKDNIWTLFVILCLTVALTMPMWIKAVEHDKKILFEIKSDSLKISK